MKAPSPAFSCYPKDVLSDERCEAMTHEEFGMYWRLVLHAWLEGSVPADPVRLQRLLKVHARKFAACWPAIGVCFEERDGRLFQLRLERQRAKQAAFSESQRLKAMKPRKSRSLNKTTEPGLSPEVAEISLPSPFPFPFPSSRTPEPEECGSGTMSATSADGQPLNVTLIQRRDPEAEVFAYWSERTKRRNPDFNAERRRVLKQRLEEEARANPGADPVDGLKLAVDGALLDPLHNGTETGRKYLEFDNVFKNKGRDRIEKLQRIAREPERAVVSGAAGDTDSVASRLVARLAAERKGEA